MVEFRKSWIAAQWKGRFMSLLRMKFCGMCHSVTERYSVPVTAGAATPLGLQATRRYRPAPQSLVEDLLGKGTLVLPVIDMASAKVEAK